MKDEELPDNWPGRPASVSGVIRNPDGTLAAYVDEKPIDPRKVPDLVAAVEREEGRDA